MNHFPFENGYQFDNISEYFGEVQDRKTNPKFYEYLERNNLSIEQALEDIKSFSEGHALLVAIPTPFKHPSIGRTFYHFSVLERCPHYEIRDALVAIAAGYQGRFDFEAIGIPINLETRILSLPFGNKQIPIQLNGEAPIKVNDGDIENISSGFLELIGPGQGLFSANVREIIPVRNPESPEKIRIDIKYREGLDLGNGFQLHANTVTSLYLITPEGVHEST